MKTAERVKGLQEDLKALYNQYDVRDKRINKYIESIGLEPGLRLLEYPRGSRYYISDFICKTDILRISSEIDINEKKLLKAVEAYLKLQCHEAYLRNNLEEAFVKAEEDEEFRIRMLKIIDKFIFE